MSVENRYAVARRASETCNDFLDLVDTNFHSCGFVYPSDSLVEAASRYFEPGSPARHYKPDPKGDRKLREAIADFYAADDLRVSADQVVVTSSASECYNHIFSSLCDGGGSALMPRPGYPIFEEIARRVGVGAVFYDQEFEAGWQIDTEKVESLVVPGTRFLVMISPNNPTGSIVDRETANRLLGVCRRNNLTLVVDEVFSDFLYDGATFFRPAIADDVVVLTINGASKLFASPDAKVSWVCVTGPDPQKEEVVDLISTQNDLYLSCSPINQILVTQMFREYPEYTRSVATEVQRRRNGVLSALSEISEISFIRPEGGIHLPLVISQERLPEWMDDETLAVALMNEVHVATHPGYLYGFDEGGVRDPFLVMSFLSPLEVLVEGVGRITRYLSEVSLSVEI